MNGPVHTASTGYWLSLAALVVYIACFFSLRHRVKRGDKFETHSTWQMCIMMFATICMSPPALLFAFNMGANTPTVIFWITIFTIVLIQCAAVFLPLHYFDKKQKDSE